MARSSTRVTPLDEETTLPVPEHVFAIFSRETIWDIDRGGTSLRLAREDAGVCATTATTAPSHVHMAASDDFTTIAERSGQQPEQLRRRLEEESAITFEALPSIRENIDSGRIRLLTSARFVSRNGDESFRSSAVVTVTVPYAHETLAAACSYERVVEVTSRISQLARSEPQPDISKVRSLPFLWSEGSGSLLLHEALGHAVGEDSAPLAWPKWLEVTDDPLSLGMGSGTFDDCGHRVQRRALTSNEQLSAWRRESFRDVPLHRMTNLRVEAVGASLTLPRRYVEVILGGHGHLDRVSGEITIRIVVADLVEGESRTRLPPFTFRVARSRVPEALRGATGAVVDYPGVICSDEGQKIAVGSSSPTLLTSPLL